MKILENEVVGRLHTHTHAPDSAEYEAAAAAVAQIKVRAERSQETSHQLVSRAVVGLSAEAATKMSSLHHLRRSIRRRRQRANVALPLPLNAQELVSEE